MSLWTACFLPCPSFRLGRRFAVDPTAYPRNVPRSDSADRFLYLHLHTSAHLAHKRRLISQGRLLFQRAKSHVATEDASEPTDVTTHETRIHIILAPVNHHRQRALAVLFCY